MTTIVIKISQMLFFFIKQVTEGLVDEYSNYEEFKKYA